MSSPAVTVESAEYDPAAGGWNVQGVIVGGEGSTRSGLQFVPLPATATPEEIRAALAALYA